MIHYHFILLLHGWLPKSTKPEVWVRSAPWASSPSIFTTCPSSWSLSLSKAGDCLESLKSTLIFNGLHQIAAISDPEADGSIGNVVAANAIGVFLGLGFPWLVAAIYWDTVGEKLFERVYKIFRSTPAPDLWCPRTQYLLWWVAVE